MKPPPFLAVIAARDKTFRLKRVRIGNHVQLIAEGAPFGGVLASGPLPYIMRRYDRLANEHLKRVTSDT